MNIIDLRNLIYMVPRVICSILIISNLVVPSQTVHLIHTHLYTTQRVGSAVLSITMMRNISVHSLCAVTVLHVLILIIVGGHSGVQVLHGLYLRNLGLTRSGLMN